MAEELGLLRLLAERFPTREAALDELASVRGALAMRAAAVHVLSDVHGEHKKLRHVIANASGSLRPLVERLFAARLSTAEQQRLLTMLHYPREAWQHFAGSGGEALLRWFIRHAGELLRELGGASPPIESHRGALVRELMLPASPARAPVLQAVIDAHVEHRDAEELVAVIAHAVRGLAIGELIVAGDLGDRGPRVDLVLELLQRQPRVAFTWGNHDAVWMGACLGQPACIATVVRNSLRYGRLAQLEEGYGIPLQSVERLAREVYGSDAAERFRPRAGGGLDPLLLARMQKAMAVLQFKLEEQTIQRNPSFGMEDRLLLSRLDLGAGTVRFGEQSHALLDAHLPTLDPADPRALAPAEEACIEELRRLFVRSAPLWRHWLFVARNGAMALRRDHALIFHGCVPVEASGAFLQFEVDGRQHAGRALFDALAAVVRRSFRERRPADLDLLWYLWAGPRSPLFGKDKMATFESYLLADPALHREQKNPYFALLHEPDFCRRVLAEFGVADPAGLIVNGHVPVKIEKGESPLKRSGLAVTIDGAFSEAYGDRGYTLVLEADRTVLAQHHHFDSVEQSIASGQDIVPTVTELRRFDPPRTLRESPAGEPLRSRAALLEALLVAYREGHLPESR